MSLFLFFEFVFLLILFSIVFKTIQNGIGPTPSGNKSQETLLRLLPANVNGVIYEMGSGWGGLAFSLAKRYPDLLVVGLENSFFPWVFAALRLKCFPQKNLRFLCRDFFSVSLADAGLLVCYLYPGAMEKIKGKGEKELPEGSWIVSHTFAIPGWKPQQIAESADIYRTKIYLYKKGTENG